MSDDDQKEGRKEGYVYLDFALIEAVFTASRNPFIQTTCPSDLRVEKVIPVENERRALVRVSSVSIAEPGEDGEIPHLLPFLYEVVDNDEAASEEG